MHLSILITCIIVIFVIVIFYYSSTRCIVGGSVFSFLATLRNKWLSKCLITFFLLLLRIMFLLTLAAYDSTAVLLDLWSLILTDRKSYFFSQIQLLACCSSDCKCPKSLLIGPYLLTVTRYCDVAVTRIWSC